MLDQAFETLKTYDYGQDYKVLRPIDDAIIASHGDAAARSELENRLTKEVANEDLNHDARQFVCRKLRAIGTAACVPTVAKLLTNEKLSHMARYALQGIPAPEAAAAIRTAAGKVDGQLKVGMISTLGDLGDNEAVGMLGKLVGDSNAEIAIAAARALGAIRTAEAAGELSHAQPNTEAEAAVADAKLACAEAMVEAGNKKEALTLYKSLATAKQKHIALAAKRGMLSSVGN